MSLREDVSRLLIRLRGDYTRQEVGDALGRSRQAISDLERGEVSLSRLEQLADFYGVDFTIVAIDRRTGRFWNETVAPGLVERIESGAGPMLTPEDTQRGRRGNGRRVDPGADRGTDLGAAELQSTGERRSLAG